MLHLENFNKHISYWMSLNEEESKYANNYGAEDGMCQSHTE